MTEKWEISGDYFESCNCEAACPCVFLSPPTTGECTVVVGWHINKGTMAGVNLSGLNFALAVHSPGHMAKVKWTLAAYVDARANDAQRKALETILSGQGGGYFAALGPFIGKVLGISPAKIEFEAKGKQRSMKIGDVGSVDIQAIEGAAGQEVTIKNNPLGIVPGEPAVVARSTRLSYHDHGFKWEEAGKNGFFSPFTYSGP
jgi:hypothetical protein